MRTCGIGCAILLTVALASLAADRESLHSKEAEATLAHGTDAAKLRLIEQIHDFDDPLFRLVIPRLLNDASEEVASATYDAVQRYGQSWETPGGDHGANILLDAIRRDYSPDKAGLRWWGRYAVRYLSDGIPPEWLVHLATDGDKRERLFAYWALPLFNPESAKTILAKVVASQDATELHEQQFARLRTGDPSVLPQVVYVFSTGDALQQRIAYQALIEVARAETHPLPDDVAASFSIDLCQFPIGTEPMRDRTIKLFSALLYSNPTDAVLAAIEKEPRSLRAAVAKRSIEDALDSDARSDVKASDRITRAGVLADKTALTVLAQALSSDDPSRIRRALDIIVTIANVLDYHGPSPSELRASGIGKALLNVIHHRESNTRRAALQTIVMMGRRCQIEPADLLQVLRAVSTDVDPWVRSGIDDIANLCGIRFEDIEPLIITMMHDPDENVRSSAVNAAAQLPYGSPAMVNALRAAANDSQWSVRSSVATAIGALHIEEMRDEVTAFLHDSNEYVRESAASTAGALRLTSAAPLLIAAAGAKENPGTELMAVGNIGDRTAVDAILPLLRRDSRHARWALVALRDIKEPSGASAIVPLLSNEDRAVADEAIHALGTSRNAVVIVNAIETQPAETAIAILGRVEAKDREVARQVGLAALRRPEPDVRKGGARLISLSDAATENDVPALLSASSDTAAEVRRDAAWALGAFVRRADVRRRLIELLRDSIDDVAQSAVYAFHAPDEELTSIARRMSADSDPTTQRRGLRLLAQWGLVDANRADVGAPDAAGMELLSRWGRDKNRDAVPRLLALLDTWRDAQEPTYNARAVRDVIYALEKIADPRAAPALIALLDDRDLTASLLEALIATRGFQATDVERYLNDHDPRIRGSALRAFATVAPRQAAITAAVAMLRDPAWEVRIEAVRTVDDLNPEGALQFLRECLFDSANVVTDEAANLLLKRHDAGVIPWIARHARSFFFGLDPAATARFLAESRDPTATAILKTIVHEREGQERVAAADALIKSDQADAIAVPFDELRATRDIRLFTIIRRNRIFPASKILRESGDAFADGGGSYLLAVRARETHDASAQFDYASNAFDRAALANNAPLALLSLWEQVNALLETNRSAEALEALKKAPEFLARVSGANRTAWQELFDERTLFWTASALAASKSADRQPAAVFAYQEVLRRIENLHVSWRWEYEEAQRLEVLARTGLGEVQLHLGRQNLEHAVEKGRDLTTRDAVEEDAETRRYLDLAQQKLITEHDAAGAQSLVEELAWRRAQRLARIDRLHLADPDRNRALTEYQHLLDGLNAIEHQLDALSNVPVRAPVESASGVAPADNLRARRAEQWRAIQKYLIDLRRTHPDLVPLLNAKPIELSKIQNLLPHSVALLQYVILPERLVCFIIRDDNVETVDAPIDEPRLRGQVAVFGAAVRNAHGVVVPTQTVIEADAAAQAVSDALLKPVTESGFLRGVNTLGIVSSGFLSGVPFAALPVAGEDGRPTVLVSKYALFEVASTSSLWIAIDRRSHAQPPASHLFAVANPNRSLAGAQEEVRNLAVHFAVRDVLENEAATREATIEGLKRRPSVVHFATHAFLKADGTRNYLLLANGKLTVEDVWGLPLDGVSLATLSACDTGVGERLLGDEIVSLENAFFFAGSSSVVATLWPVNDNATKDLMSSFYSELAKGRPAAAALQTAQLETRKKYSDPQYWAGFVLHGQWK